MRVRGDAGVRRGGKAEDELDFFCGQRHPGVAITHTCTGVNIINCHGLGQLSWAMIISQRSTKRPRYGHSIYTPVLTSASVLVVARFDRTA